MIESLCIRVPRAAGELTRKRLIELHLFDTDLKIKPDGDYLLIPVLKPVKGLGVPGKDIFERLENKSTLSRVPGAYELIGDIAIIDQHEENAPEIADILLKHKNIQTVFQAASAVCGEYRTRELLFIKGEKKIETIYRENECRYLLDVTQVYFTPRLSTERIRITDQVKNGEKVIDMFAGIGPFSILIAKRAPASQVIAIDKNPVAIKYLKENARLNKVKNIEIREGDAREEVKGISDADRIIMNLPHSGLQFLDSAFGVIKSGGTIHFYAISHENNLFDGLTREVETIAERLCVQVFPLQRRVVRPYAPYQYNVCIDFKVSL